MTDNSSEDDLVGWWDLAPAADDKIPEPKEKQLPVLDNPSDTLSEALENSGNSLVPQDNQATLHNYSASQDDQATLHNNSENSEGEGSGKRSFTLPNRATLPPALKDSATQKKPAELDDLLDDTLVARPKMKKSLSLDPPPTSKVPTITSPEKASPFTPPKSDESLPKAYGRSAEVQEAPLHGSWSSSSDDTPPVPEKNSGDGLSSVQKDSQKSNWSAIQSHQKQGPQSNTWAAALKAAASEPTGQESPFDDPPVQGTKARRPMAIEDIPEEEPVDTSAEFENLSQPTGQPKETKKGREVFFLLSTALLVLLALGSVTVASYHYFTNRVAAPSDNSTPNLDNPLNDDATIWLASAQESLDSKDFKLAVAQLEKAVSFLKQSEGEKRQLKETQVVLATTYSKAGDYTASALLWTELAKSHPDLRKKGRAAAASAFRENRIIANKRIKTGEKAVSNKKFDNAIRVAKEALDLYEVSQGKNSQMARAHGVMGDAYRGKQNTRIAFNHFTKASKLDPQGRYKSELRKIKLPRRPRKTRPAKRAKPKFVIETGVPQGKATR